MARAAADPFPEPPLTWLAAGSPAADSRPWYAAADDVHRPIRGFTSDAAVAPGESVAFRVTVEPPRPFTVEVYRVGHYAGHGAARMAVSPPLDGLTQPPPLVAGRAVACHHWWLSWRLDVPPHWPPGAYVAVLAAADGERAHVPFTVRDGTAADLLLVLPDLTWQAHNVYPEDGRTGAGLRHAWDERGRLLGEADAAVTVSADRPYAGTGLPPDAGPVYDVIRWAERYGYDLGYAHATDLHAGRVDPTRYRGLVFPGPDRYWTAPLRRAVEAARDAGTSLVFLGAGALARQVVTAPSPAGPDRLLTCRRQRSGSRAAPWRDIAPEQQLLGIQHAGRVPRPAPLVVRNTDHWLWEGTGAAEGDELPGLVAGDADRYHPRTALPPHTERILLAHSPYRDADGVRRHQETSLYRAPGGALVFASGTSGWAPALDRPGHADPRVQRATANLLDHICKRA
ncbi:MULTISPECIES: N,N-dimethylformamidase beta subunit family domain-containing protein [Streptomyces]|uniref:N,N-dimethylformamidase beta subunit family domain-containing protein n=1 Tax=Streptomyces TaxID=1883 RepID=UPI00163BE74A|nr:MULTISPECIES: N,N-dimethylformamidase beta subunit family domain-containing protein [Streptomyces]MBC2877913.1 phosphoribosylamine--glycine ligase [Streptomyces sp. TYQ1024]UBI41144.1 phosphoribosylamine--glycine ligase [Streptomyces mobaraensis]UKW33637.1 phosphoribosylamine--glycine ligase [Streptomyces sp. TYQ1024]